MVRRAGPAGGKAREAAKPSVARLVARPVAARPPVSPWKLRFTPQETEDTWG